MTDNIEQSSAINRQLNPKVGENALTQSDKFKDAAREISADEDEARWEERLKAIARQKPKDSCGSSEA